MNRKMFFIICILLLIGVNAYSQVNYSIKVETGYIKYQTKIVQVEPGPDWKGYYLDNENGIDLNVINGIKYKDKFYAGLGLGYVNFEGKNGWSIFSDFEFLPLKTRLTPLINLKIGYNHISNQYKNGTGTELIEFGFGLNYRLTKELGVHIKSGLLMTQQSSLIPIRLGLRF